MPTNERIPNDAPTQRTSDYVSYDSRSGKAQSTPMFHIAGYYKNISATLINCILSDVENVQNVYAEYMQEFQSVGQVNSTRALKSSDVVSNPIVQAEQVAKATKELTVNSASIGTDKKSAKDTKNVIAPVVTEQKQESLTIVEYLMRELNLTASEAMQFKGDADAIAMYNKYVASFVPVKKELTFKELLAQKNTPNGTVHHLETSKLSGIATEKTKQETAKLLKAAKKQFVSTAKTLAAIETPKKSKGIPVSFSVQMKGNESEIFEDNKTRAMNNLVDKVLERVSIKNGEKIVDTKRITSVPIGSSPAHYFEELARQRYIFNVKELAQ